MGIFQITFFRKISGHLFCIIIYKALLPGVQHQNCSIESYIWDKNGYQYNILTSMKLLLNYKGINKIMSKVQNYAGIVQFVHENFFLKMSRWGLTYIDSDGDSIALDSDLDVQTMLDTVTKDHLKVYIKDIEVGQEINISNAGSSKLAEEASMQDEIEITEVKEVVIQEKIDEPVATKASTVEKVEENSMPDFENQQKNQCRWKEHWKKKMEEKMAKFVDERVENLIPCLVKKIEEKMNNKTDSKSDEKTLKTRHDVKCTGCGKTQIFGIRYKCTKCPSFDFCESCEATISHDHNMIKMRFIEEPEKVEKDNEMRGHRGGWWRRHHEEKQSKHCGYMKWNQSDQENPKVEETDENLKLTKKCFKLSKFFGQKPQNYREFVVNNLGLKFHELTQLYISENGQEVIKSQETNAKIQQKIEKLSFYFDEPKEKFESLLKRMPGSNLKELIKTIQEEKRVQKEESSVKTEKAVDLSQESSKIEEIKEEQKIEEVKEQIKEEVKEKKKEQNKAWGWGGVFGRKPVDVKKKNECIIMMKEFFGPDKVYDYIKFFDENSELSQEQIVSKYIESLTQ